MRMLGPALVIGLALTGGCSSSTDSPEATAAPVATDICTAVRAGIDAFNLGDYTETIDRFRVAVPLAVEQAKDDDSKKATELVEAVKYYADLSPEEYPEAARSSADFAKYKSITLGQCVPVGQPDAEPPPVTT